MMAAENSFYLSKNYFLAWKFWFFGSLNINFKYFWLAESVKKEIKILTGGAKKMWKGHSDEKKKTKRLISEVIR